MATATEGGSLSPGSATVPHGSSAEFTVIPEAGFGIDQVTGCAGSLRGDTYTSEDTKTDGAVNASFRFKEYDLSANVNEGGEVSGFPAKVQHGQPAELELIAEEGGAVLCSARQLGNYALIGVWGKC